MISYINGATAPYLLGGIGLLVLLAFLKTIRAWKETKRSPYFFLRLQAERRLRANLWTMFGLLALAGGTLAFASQAPPDDTVRMALIINAKPVEAAAPALDELPVVSFDDIPESIEISSITPDLEGASTLSGPIDLPIALDVPESLEIQLTPVLPEEFDQYEPSEELRPDTDLTPLVFSTEINDAYKPVTPRRVFGEGLYTIFATFDYEGMADGMEWAWVWRRNGEVVNGGNELWAYGDGGPGWIFYEPPEGYQPGEYTLEVWVNGELFQRASLTVESEVANE